MLSNKTILLLLRFEDDTCYAIRNTCGKGPSYPVYSNNLFLVQSL
ncbi:hypothetical protein B0I21_10773 [Sphingobacterium paludis]|uniref:Uncharacterized protein n=1 Tax=Sphingobacterium paludis TaxID=1476465 RepID=A0A4R7CV80_9SPHI|nr:hypothetical protein B0I21_10773 [Sphingobacterium paludis]